MKTTKYISDSFHDRCEYGASKIGELTYPSHSWAGAGLGCMPRLAYGSLKAQPHSTPSLNPFSRLKLAQSAKVKTRGWELEH